MTNIQNIFDTVGRGIDKSVNYYKNNKFINATVNTLGIYAGFNCGPDIADVVMNVSSNVKDIADILAPVAAGAYCFHKTGNIENGNVKALAQFTIAAMVGADLGHEIGEYKGHMSLIKDLLRRKILYGSRQLIIRNSSFYPSFAETGAIIGTATCIAGKIFAAYSGTKNTCSVG